MIGNIPREAVTNGSEWWWPSPLPGADLDYSFPVGGELNGDSVVTIALSLAPSGTGEMQALDLSLTGELIVVQLTGGQPGRLYRAQLVVTGASGRVWQFIINILVSKAAEVLWPMPPAPVPGFGTAINWISGATVFGPAIAAVATGLVLTGTNQATAFPLLAQTNIVAAAPSSTGGILPGTIVSGTIVVQDDDANNAAIYPPVGAQINALGVNVPFIVNANGGRINFSTQSPTTQWWAG
jgi:hypothetical protein